MFFGLTIRVKKEKRKGGGKTRKKKGEKKALSIWTNEIGSCLSKKVQKQRWGKKKKEGRRFFWIVNLPALQPDVFLGQRGVTGERKIEGRREGRKEKREKRGKQTEPFT